MRFWFVKMRAKCGIFKFLQISFLEYMEEIAGRVKILGWHFKRSLCIECVEFESILQEHLLHENRF